MRQQLLNPAIRMRGQARENIFQIGVGIMPVHLRRLDQTHHGSRTPARPQGAGEQPVLATQGDGPDLVLDPVVIDG